jgi:hypothetical protein
MGHFRSFNHFRSFSIPATNASELRQTSPSITSPEIASRDPLISKGKTGQPKGNAKRFASTDEEPDDLSEAESPKAHSTEAKDLVDYERRLEILISKIEKVVQTLRDDGPVPQR